MRYLIVLVLSVALWSTEASAENLYNDLGEKQGIEKLMEDLLLNIADDRRIRHHFEDTDIMHLHQMLSEQICELSGGPCVYSGDDMVTSHTNMGVTRSDFNALVENLQQAMNDNEVPVGVQNRLLALLVPMHEEIVGL